MRRKLWWHQTLSLWTSASLTSFPNGYAPHMKTHAAMYRFKKIFKVINTAYLIRYVFVFVLLHTAAEVIPYAPHARSTFPGHPALASSAQVSCRMKFLCGQTCIETSILSVHQRLERRQSSKII